MQIAPRYDALLLVSFGGPEGPGDVMPFLERVTTGRKVPRGRLEEVAEHYRLFGGTSPINAQNRALLAALIEELNAHGPTLAVYWGNRHWHPLLTDAIQQMADDGVQAALAFVTSAFGSYSSCRAYVEDIERARRELGPAAPRIDKLRLYFNHPGFIEAWVDRIQESYAQIPERQRELTPLLYTAHSIPATMAANGPYESQLRETCRLVSAQIGREGMLAYQSRSGPPSQPWLGPDVAEYLRQITEGGRPAYVVVAPIGFVSDHIEVIYDLDVALAAEANRLGVNLVRAATVGRHPRFVQMIRQLAAERLDPSVPRLSLGDLGTWPDECPPDCCRQD